MNDRLHRADLRMIEECRQRGTDHRLAGNLAILFGHVAARAQAPSAGDDNSSDGVRHFTLRAIPAWL